MFLAIRSWAVPTWSKVRLWIREMWTPRSLWTPLHSIHITTPKFVEIHVESDTDHHHKTLMNQFDEIHEEPDTNQHHKTLLKQNQTRSMTASCNLPFCPLQSTQRSFPGNLRICLVICCCISRREALSLCPERPSSLPADPWPDGPFDYTIWEKTEDHSRISNNHLRLAEPTNHGLWRRR